MSRRLFLRLSVTVLAPWVFGAAGLAAQAEDSMVAVSGGSAASPHLPSDHWAVRAARRAEALGLANGFLPAQRPVPLSAVESALRAAARAAGGSPSEGLASGWYARFVEEFSPGSAPVPGMRRSSGGVGYAYREGDSAPGGGVFPDATGATPGGSADEWALALEVAASLAPPLVVAASPVVSPDGLEVPRWEITAGWRGWGLSLGREAVGWGYGVGGGILLSAATVDLVQLYTARPIVLPGWLRVLGPTALHTFLSRLPEERHPGSPVFWGGSGSIRPHPRLTLSVHRAAVLGGSEVPGSLSAWEIGLVAIGDVTPNANQLVSVEGRFRLPTERVLPATLYCEWGAEDAAGAWWDVPGITCGTLFPSLPGLPEVAAGAEFAYFGPSCCNNPPWYRHRYYPGAWALDEAPLGHPLGGEGSQWLGYVQASALASRLRMEGHVLLRERRGDNLFVPGREGGSFAVAGEVAWRLLPSAEARLSAARESGDGWDETRFSLWSTWYFR